MMTPPTNTLRYCPRKRSAMKPPRIGVSHTELVQRGEQLGNRFARGLRLEAGVGRAHVFEDALLGARGDDRLRAPFHEHVGPALGPTILLDRHQPEDGVRAPVLAVSQKDHPVALDFHGASGASSVARRAVTVPVDQGCADAGPETPQPAHGLRRFRMSSSATRSIFPSIRTRTS